MDPQKTFALVGAAGYIAPRHLQAISALGHRLITAHDLSDSVGILDRYFPRTDFTPHPDTFRDSLAQLRPDYLTICTPNYLHAQHIAWGLNAGADAICEKPLGLSPAEIDRLIQDERTSGRHVYTILQLRLHPEVAKLKKQVENAPRNKIYDIDLTYITPRGKWYAASWKGDPQKSGGLAMNIGVHFYDMLLWIFGPVERSLLHCSTPQCVAGYLQLKKARVRYLLSIDAQLALRCRPEGPVAPYRSLRIEGREIDFSAGFTDLHTQSYRRILQNEGFTPQDTREAINCCGKSATPIRLLSGAITTLCYRTSLLSYSPA